MVGAQGGAQTTNPLEAALNAEQPLYRGGRTVAGVARAESEVDAQRAVLRSVEQGVLLGAVTAYMDVWRDQAVLRLTVNNEQVLARQLEATQDRFEVGELTRTDVAQSEARLARATAQRIAAEGGLTASRAVFQEVVGFLPGTLDAPPALEGLPASEQEVVGAARDDNPAVLSARFAEQAARHQIDVSRGQLLPEAFLTGEARHSEEVGSKDGETDLARGLVEVTVPLYQRGLVSSQVRESKQFAIQRSREIEESSRFAERVAIESWEDLETAQARSVSFQSEVRSSEIALEGVRQENAVGARTILDVLDAEQELLDAQVNLTRARRDEIVASYQVLSAMGRLTARNLELDVELYDPLTDYQAVRNRWYGLEAPGTVE
jgi:TolC family type I secretion outer membrane protein